jgi:dUTP pyrophosphatase
MEVIEMKLQIQRTTKEVDMPSYSHDGDAAFDLRAAEEGVLKPGEKKVFKTGLKMAIPSGHVGLIWDRSGLAAKNGVHVLAGVVDSGYRGEVGVVLKNLGEEDIEITLNMRIAQMLIQPVVSANLEETENLDDTERGEGGFGSTGKH